MGTSTDPAGSPKWGTAKQQTTTAIASGALTAAKIEQIVSSFVQGLQQTPESGFGPTAPEHPNSTTTPPDQIPSPDPTQSPQPMTAPPAGSARLPGRTGGGGGSGGSGGGRSGSASRGGKGGGRGGSRGERSGGGVRGAAHNLAQFITTVAETGLSQALADVGLTSLDGKTPSEIAFSIVSALCGPNSTIDQVDLHTAMSATMDKVLGDAKEFKECELALKEAAPTVKETLGMLFGNYIYERFCSISYANVLAKIGAERVEAAMGEIKDYIASKVNSLSYEKNLGSINWKGDEGITMVNQILQQTESVFSV